MVNDHVTLASSIPMQMTAETEVACLITATSSVAVQGLELTADEEGPLPDEPGAGVVELEPAAGVGGALEVPRVLRRESELMGIAYLGLSGCFA